MKIRMLVIAFMLVIVTIGVGSLVACDKPADVASHNLSNAADNFEIQRRIVFINGITDKYLLVIEGRCSLGNDDKTGEISVTCKIGENQYTKHFMGLSDNVTYVVEQLDAASVDTWHYQVNFRPETLIPDIRH